MGLYTDLASEAREMNPDIDGVTEESEATEDVTVTRIQVTNETAAKKLNKLMGKYITIDAPQLTDRPLDLFEAVSVRVSEELQKLTENIPNDAQVLVVGLGNRRITPDSLGPQVAEKVFVTRHVKQYVPEAFEYPLRSVSAVAPGVLGATGIETLEVIRGIVERVKPDVIIAIDSLASRRAARISTTIQISDTGISPGSGVGNLQAGLNKESLGVPVIAIGVPLVVRAATITQDTISLIAEETGLHNDEDKLKELAEKVSDEKLGSMIVTPKDIDTIINDMSGIVAKAINMAVYREHYEDVRNMIA